MKTPSEEPPASGSVTVREPAQPDHPLAREPESPLANPGGPAAAPAGSVWCANCQTHVDPAGKGLCPVCGRFLPDNTIALVTGLRSKKLAKVVDAYRVDLIEQLFAERGGRDALDVVSRIAIENYALVCAQHKTIEARLDQDGLFTQTGRRRSAFDMLKGISETIDRLRAELPPPITHTRLSPDDFAAMNDDQLIEKTTAILRSLLEMRDEKGKGQLLIEALGNSEGHVVHAGDEGEEARRRPAPASQPTCTWCHKALDKCAAMKTERPDVFEVLHYDSPEEIEKRRQYNTAVMLKTMAHGSGITRW